MPRALITAGGAGLGREIALLLASRGVRVEICDVDVHAMEALAREHDDIGVHDCDVADPAAVDRLFEAIANRHGGLDILVNNAGIAGPTCAPEDIAPRDWERVMAVNVHGMFHCVRRAIPLLREAGGGSIVNISSMAVWKGGYPGRLAYATSKKAVIGFSETLAMELGRFGIRVNTVMPGAMMGPRLRGVIERSATHRGVSFADECRLALTDNSMRKFMTRTEVAEVVAFLCSDAARHVSGQTISVCGNFEGERSWSSAEPDPELPREQDWME